MGNKYDSRKRVFFSVLAVFLTVCLIFFGFRIYMIFDSYFSKVDVSDDDAYSYKSDGLSEYLVDGKWYIQKSQLETFLFIGIDKYEAAIPNEKGYRNNQQSDALFLITVNHHNKTYSILQINRDTMANIRMLDINGNPYNSFVGQIAVSHTYGSGQEDSCENTVWSVSDYLYGLKIDHYGSVSMDGVSVLNDAIGGVTLVVLDDMTVIDESLSKGSTVTLHGNQALSYIRARGELADSTNIARMERQRQYVTAFLEQAKIAIANKTSLTSDMVLSVSKYLVSDLTVRELVMFSDQINNYSFDGLYTIEGIARKGEKYMEFYADETALKNLVLEIFYDEK